MVNQVISLEDDNDDQDFVNSPPKKITKQSKTSKSKTKAQTKDAETPKKKPGRQSEKSKIEEIMQLSQQELKNMCLEENLPTSGAKHVLVERLLNPSIWSGGRKRNTFLATKETAAAINARINAQRREEKKQRLAMLLEKVRNKSDSK